MTVHDVSLPTRPIAPRTPPTRRPGRERPIRYCRHCVMPETRPDILFDDAGVCSACRHYERRPHIDWDARRRELLEVVAEYRDPDGTNYDCIVPVSGGKDKIGRAHV